jgi:hypothetical protein
MANDREQVRQQSLAFRPVGHPATWGGESGVKQADGAGSPGLLGLPVEGCPDNSLEQSMHKQPVGDDPNK